MNKKLRKAIIAGNWKMNKNIAETADFIGKLNDLVKTADCEVVICVPAIDLETAVKNSNNKVKIGGQNCHFKTNGAFTGEISAEMLKSSGVEYVIIGHSERRQYFAETDLTVNRRTKAALAADLIPIICVGETLSEREDGITEDVVELQTVAAFTGISAENAKKTVIAYEPVWAIGTGKVASDEQAEEVCGFIRKVIADKYGKEIADSLPILYGGSMNTKNVAGLLAMENIDGGLIGGASLKVEDFSELVAAASK